MLITLVIIVHVLVCTMLVLTILLQSGKGADIGAVFGGGSSQTLFGATGATTFLHKVTVAAAIVFMVTSIGLTYFAGKAVPVERSIMSGEGVTGAPAGPTDPAAAPVETKSEAPAQDPGERPAKPALPEAEKPAQAPQQAVPAPSPEKQ
ncbi:MAG: preprotein translocase subunit SecG [Deltaproteobacteria bacterium]|nr:preprotein translocase subunit SecG [Deltaproteobacteria bacterium]